MPTSRREFLGTAAAAAGAALVSSCSPGGSGVAPYQVTATKDQGGGGIMGTVVSPGVAGPLGISSRLAINSGAPLGGIGTGFVEIHPDGCFYEWQIFNGGGWSGRRTNATAAAPPRGPQYLRFLLWTKTAGESIGQIRRLYLRSDDNSLYSMPNVQDIESIDYDAWFPITGLRYNDPTLPVRLSATIFSPFVPGDARTSATPGFTIAFTVENTSGQDVEATIVGFFDDPILTGATDPKLRHTRATKGNSTSLFLQTEAQPADLAGLGSMCISVTGGEHSCINGTFRQYSLPGLVAWRTDRVRSMELDVMQELLSTGRLANAEADRDMGREFNLTDAQIDQLSAKDLQSWVERLSTDALFRRVLSDAAVADPAASASVGQSKALLKEIARFADGQPAWGTAGLASSVKLSAGQNSEVRFALSWFFPHHISRPGRDMGHMYANWFDDAAEVNQFLVDHYGEHRAATELFARTLADTTLGSAIAFAWSAQLSLAITCTWWTKDGAYAIWEGLGCCGLSTTDVDYQGSFPITALFPELKLGQMKRMIGHQNGLGQVPHNYMMDVNVVDNGWNRVDMNPQFVMMACRDYLWTGDRSYLEFMWPHVVKAMDFTASLDTDGDGLPDKDCGVQTYDQWRMRGAPSYIASLWIGGLRAAIRLAKDMNRPEDVQRWTALLEKASASFDKVLFNGDYYSLWVDGQARDEVCMSDQISGEWFSHLIGLDSTISPANMNRAVDIIWKYNFTPDFGLHNASAPRGGLAVLAVTNLQAGGVWSGIEYAVASFLMDHGRYADGMRIVEAVHQRYLRAGQPWNHVECGSHYTRAMCSWTTLLAATGFKPDAPAQALTIAPAAPGDFHAPWATASGFGTIRRRGAELTIECVSGVLAFKKLRVAGNGASVSARLAGRALPCRTTQEGAMTGIEFDSPVEIRATKACAVTNL